MSNLLSVSDRLTVLLALASVATAANPCSELADESVYHFDCASAPQLDPVPMFGMNFYPPRNFERDARNNNSFVLRKTTAPVFGATIDYDFVEIRYGRRVATDKASWTLVVKGNDTVAGNLNLQVFERKTSFGNDYSAFEYWIQSGDEFLHITSFVPIAWESIVPCIL